MNNRKSILFIRVSALIVALLSAVGYVVFVTQPSTTTTSSVTESAPFVSLEKHTILLKKIPIVFELPKGYVAFQREGFEGDYVTSISIGKEVAGGHFTYAPLEIEFFPTFYDTQHEREYSPSEYIDIVFNEQKMDSISNPRYMELFGNRAVQYTNAADESLSIVGYLRADQLPELGHEYLVKISTLTYGRGVGADNELLDTVFSSLKVNK